MVIAAVKSAYWTVAGRRRRRRRRSGTTREHEAVAAEAHSASAVATTSPSDGADRAQDQAVVGLVALGAHHEEDRQRDPEAVLVHAEQPVGGDPGGQRGAEAERVADARPSRRVRFARRRRDRAAGCSRPSPAPRAARSPATQTSSDQATCSEAAERCARASAGSASPARADRPWAISSASATERPTIASRSETQKQ